MSVQVWSEAGQQWLDASLNFQQRYVWWHGGPVSFNVEVRLSGDDAARARLLASWGYRRVEIVKED